MTNVTGTIAGVPAPAEVRTHTEPDNQSINGEKPSGTQASFSLNVYRNTGNVSQTVTVNGITSPQNCSFVSSNWYYNGATVNTSALTLQPGEQASLTVNIQLATLNPGSSPTPFSFSISPTWS